MLDIDLIGVDPLASSDEAFATTKRGTSRVAKSLLSPFVFGEARSDDCEALSLRLLPLRVERRKEEEESNRFEEEEESGETGM